MNDNFQLGGINYHPDEELLKKLDKENEEAYDKYIEQRDKHPKRIMKSTFAVEDLEDFLKSESERIKKEYSPKVAPRIINKLVDFVSKFKNRENTQEYREKLICKLSENYKQGETVCYYSYGDKKEGEVVTPPYSLSNGRIVIGIKGIGVISVDNIMYNKSRLQNIAV